MMGNAMSLLLLAAEQFNVGSTCQQEVDIRVPSVMIVALNVGDQMMKGNAIQIAQVIGSGFPLVIDTPVLSLLIAPSSVGEPMKWDSAMCQWAEMMQELICQYPTSQTCKFSGCCAFDTSREKMFVVMHSESLYSRDCCV